MLRPPSVKAVSINLSFVRTYAFKSDLKIKWVRPEKIPKYKPEKSGDLEPMHKINVSQLQPEFRNSKELETANEFVKRLFSLEFAPRSKLTQVYNGTLINSVKRHTFDSESEEAKIAKWTGAIRGMQDLMERFPRNKRLKVRLQEMIDNRNKHLKYLRKFDYKKYEWLLEKLNIVYKPVPTELIKVTRKDSLRKLTKKYCDNIKEDRLLAYKLHLQAEQPAFLQEKITTLEFIRDEQKKCNVEVTVTQEEIDEVKQQLEELRKRAMAEEEK